MGRPEEVRVRGPQVESVGEHMCHLQASSWSVKAAQSLQKRASKPPHAMRDCLKVTLIRFMSFAGLGTCPAHTRQRLVLCTDLASGVFTAAFEVEQVSDSLSLQMAVT